MIHHFYAMGGAIPYARTALKTEGDDIKAVLTPVKRANKLKNCNIGISSSRSTRRVSAMRIYLKDELVVAPATNIGQPDGRVT
jgi:hypothetical protein